MDVLSEQTLKTLATHHQAPSVSLFLPTHKAGPDTRENPIRFKNLVQNAQQQLESSGMGPREITGVLGDAQALIDDNDFWQHQSDGFAMFLSKGVKEKFRVPITLPELALVGARFHLKPLMPLLSNDGQFFVLAVSLNQVRLFEASRYGIAQRALTDKTPLSMAEALRFDDPEKSLQAHTVSGRESGAGRPDVSFHGSGAGDPDKKEQILRFFRMLDNGVRDTLQDAQRPLVFAGVDYLFSLYQEANHYNHLFDTHVSGNPDDWRDEDVHEKAWNVIASHFEDKKRTALQQYKTLAYADNTSENIDEIVPAAIDARIDTLIVGVGEQLWGHYNPDTRTIEHHDAPDTHNDDLLNYAAIHTLLNGGTVYAVPKEHVPNGGLIAAIYRF